MKKNRDREIVKCIDSLTALIICEEKEREFLEKTLDIGIINPKTVLQLHGEQALVSVAMAYGADIAYEPLDVPGYPQFTQKLSIEVNGIMLFALA